MGVHPQSLAREAPATSAAPARATVVIPCYNQSHFLGECLDSVVAQTYSHWEAVVVDDCSPDGEEIQRVVEEYGDARIRLVRHERNKGLGGSRNTGIRESRTEFVLPLDSDDRITADCLERLVGALSADPELDCAFADVQLFGRLSEVLEFPGPPPGRPLLRAEHTIPGAGTMMRKALWERLGGYDEAEVLRMGREDFEFWIRAFRTGCRFQRFREPVYEYRHLHTSMNVVCRLQDHEIAEYIYSKHKDLYDQENEGDNFRCFWLAKAARASYLEGKRWRAFKLAMKSWRLVPSRSRLVGAVRAFLPYSTNEAIYAGAIRRAVPFVGYPLRGEERQRPFFLIGVGGLGNRLLHHVLTSHSQLHIPPETFVIGECIRKFSKYDSRMTWPDLVSFILSRFQLRSEFERLEMDLGPVYRRLCDLPMRQRNLATVFDVFFREHARQHDVECVRWGDKTPINSLSDSIVRGDEPRRIGAGVPETLARLARIYPEGQFLHIYRDGCDVVQAYLRSGFFSRLEEAAQRWLHVETQCRRFSEQHAERSRFIRFEDVFERTEETLRSICEFLGVEFEPEMLAGKTAPELLQELSASDSPSRIAAGVDEPGQGRRLLSADDRAKLDELLGPMLAQLGYPPATAGSQ